LSEKTLRGIFSSERERERYSKGACSIHASDEKYIHNFDQERQGKRPLWKTGSGWTHDAKIDLREIVWKCVDWFHVARDRVQCLAVVNTVMNLWLP